MVGGTEMNDPELVIQYFPDSDTLRLGVGEPPAEGETIAKWLMVEWSKDEEVTGVVLRNAAKVLRPYLFPEQGTEIETRNDELGNKNNKDVTVSTPEDSTGKSTD
jgi:uncharacterized protein YuzE